MTVELNFHPTDAAVADQLRAVLNSASLPLSDAPAGRGGAHVIVLSPAAVEDSAVLDRLYAALDAGAHIVAVSAQPVAVPKLIDHVTRIDGSDTAVVRAAVAAALSPDAGYAMRVATPRIQRANRRALVVGGGFIIALFAFYTWAIASFDIEAPRAEFDRVDTEAAQTRDFLIEPTMQYLATYLPRSTEAAAAFPATVDAAVTRVQPFFAGTATALQATLASFELTPETTPAP